MENKYINFEEYLAKAEYPFIRADMTPEEYEKEYAYYVEHSADVRNGTYKPLWKQNG